MLGISCGVALLQESINYALVYRTSAYRGVKESIDRASKKLDSLRSGAVGVLAPRPQSTPPHIHTHIHTPWIAPR